MSELYLWEAIVTSHGFLNYSSRLWSEILLLSWWNNLNSNRAAKSECQGTPVLLEMKLHYMMGKLVTWGGRWETLFSPWRIRQTMDRDWPKYLIPILHPIFSVPVISLQLTWSGEGGIPQLWCFSSDNFWAALLGSNVYLREKFYFHSSFDTTGIWFLRHQ